MFATFVVLGIALGIAIAFAAPRYFTKRLPRRPLNDQTIEAYLLSLPDKADGR
jgi:hypothetical protein